MPNIQTAVNFMVNTANDNSHGYDQENRNGPDYDCSSLVATALNKAGFDVPITAYTGDIEKYLTKCGFKKCSTPWKAGDIHITPGKHMCMSIDASRIAQASINEKGKTTGGKTGDQTGNEINIRAYYDYPWTSHYRYTAETGGKDYSGVKRLEYKPTIKEVYPGDSGVNVLLVQEILRARGFKGADGKELVLDRIAGKNTVYAITEYQKAREKVNPGICGGIDGIAGTKTLKDMVAM